MSSAGQSARRRNYDQLYASHCQKAQEEQSVLRKVDRACQLHEKDLAKIQYEAKERNDNAAETYLLARQQQETDALNMTLRTAESHRRQQQLTNMQH